MTQGLFALPCLFLSSLAPWLKLSWLMPQLSPAPLVRGHWKEQDRHKPPHARMGAPVRQQALNLYSFTDFFMWNACSAGSTQRRASVSHSPWMNSFHWMEVRTCAVSMRHRGLGVIPAFLLFSPGVERATLCRLLLPRSGRALGEDCCIPGMLLHWSCLL